MEAIEYPARAPAERVKAAPVAAAIGALALVIVGALVIYANVLRDDDGYFTSSTERVTSSGYAITRSIGDVSAAPRWALADIGLDGVRVQAESKQPLFIGIARSDDLDRYLSRIGPAPHRAPLEETFWFAAAQRSGTVALEWEPVAGDWRAVVMNADGSRGVTAELEFGARTSLLWWVGAALVGGGFAAATAAAVLHARARRKAPIWDRITSARWTRVS